jgi:ribonuclease P protein component
MPSAGSVDEPTELVGKPHAVWLGLVVPKRHAKRAVTRNLVKRQVRAVVKAHAPSLSGGMWVVRLRAPFDRQRFVSAASEALKSTVRAEMDALMLRTPPELRALTQG